MTRLSVPLCLALAGLFSAALLPRANADTFAGYPTSEESPSNDVLGNIDVTNTDLMPDNTALIGAFARVQTGGPVCTPVVSTSFPLDLATSTSCAVTDIFSVKAAFSADGGPSGLLYLSLVSVLPQTSDVDLLVVRPASATSPPQEFSSVWLLAGLAAALALLGGRRVLRIRRTSANRL